MADFLIFRKSSFQNECSPIIHWFSNILLYQSQDYHRIQYSELYAEICSTVNRSPIYEMFRCDKNILSRITIATVPCEWRWLLKYCFNRGKHSSANWISHDVWSVAWTWSLGTVKPVSDGKRILVFLPTISEQWFGYDQLESREKRLLYFLRMKCFQLNVEDNGLPEFNNIDITNTVKKFMDNEDWSGGDEDRMEKINQLYDEVSIRCTPSFRNESTRIDYIDNNWFESLWFIIFIQPHDSRFF